MEYGNGITGDMCVHMYDTVRWMLDLGWPKKITATGGIYVQTEGKSNIADTQTAIFEHDSLNCVWQHRSWGNPVDPEYPWSFKLFGEKGTLSGSTMKADFVSHDKNVEPIHFAVIAVLNLIIGLTTPPVGVCLFVASSIGKVSIGKVSKAGFPFLLVSLAVLILVTLIPEISLWLPSLFME